MVSKASDDLPEPERPVNTTSLSRGMARSMFFRLCSRAPRMVIARPPKRASTPGPSLGSRGGGEEDLALAMRLLERIQASRRESRLRAAYADARTNIEQGEGALPTRLPQGLWLM